MGTNPNSVLAVWLDSMDPELMEEMMASGELPCLADLRARGAYGRLEAPHMGFAETNSSMVLNGASPTTTSQWEIRDYDPATYQLIRGGACDFSKVPAFYALGDQYRVVAFDVHKARPQPGVNGLQVSSWGCHAAAVPRESSPPELYGELVGKYGEHRAGDNQDYANLDSAPDLVDLHARFLDGLRKRAAVTVDLWQRGPWDLFFAAFTENHGAGHYFFTRPELPEAAAACGGWRMLRDIYRETDRCLARLLEAAGDQVTTVIFSTEGMRRNCDDLASLVFLPELLARYSFPGQTLMDFRKATGTAATSQYNWQNAIWSLARKPKRLSRWLRTFLSPDAVAAWEQRLGLRPALFDPKLAPTLNYQALTWYRPYWRHMRAFALPTALEGIVRLNVRGRERHGLIDPSEYAAECDRISALLTELIDPVTGKPAVAEVIRTRPKLDLAAEGRHLPPGDLHVMWSEGLGNRLRSPRFGEMGPLPFHRSGSHTPRGFICATGPGIPAGASLPTGHALDVAPTILQLMGLPLPAHLEGKPLVTRGASAETLVLRPKIEALPPPPRLAMTLCVRNEDRFLAENLLYHRALGVDIVYLYLDGSTDRSLEIARAFSWVVIVEMELKDHPAHCNDFHTATMDHALNQARRDGFDWLLTLDPDEFAFGGADPSSVPAGRASWAGNLPRMLAEVPPQIQMVKLPTLEALPQVDCEGAPFWKHRHFLMDPLLEREIFHPVTGERRTWKGALGHIQGKSIVRVSAQVQAYDSHRWVVDHGRQLPDRPDYVPIPTETRGAHLHYNITDSRHWWEKYLKIGYQPTVWTCGSPVEYPKQCWKEASAALSAEGAREYFERWVGFSDEKLESLEKEGRAIPIDIVRQVLEENDLMREGQLIPLLKPFAAPSQTPSAVVRDLGELIASGDSRSMLSLEIGRLSPRFLRGFHPVEQAHHRVFRWSEPEAGILLELAPRDYRVTLDLDCLAVHFAGLQEVTFNERSLPIIRSAEGRLHFDLPGSLFKATGENWLNFRFQPVDTSAWPGETRQLGAPLFKLGLKKLDAVAIENAA